MAKGYRFNPPPNWPTPPQGWEPDRDWRKPPEWPEPPAGWQVWVPRKSNSGLVLGVVGGVLGLVMLVGAIGTATGDDATEPAAASTPSSTDCRDAPEWSQAHCGPGETATTEPTTEPIQSTQPATHKPDPKPHKHVSVRKFRKIAKDPDSYLGKRVIIFAEVTQFDSATGTDAFLAYAGAEKKRPEYGFVDYTQNTMFTGTEHQLGDVVQGDLVKVRATCLGSLDYDTQIGGQTTVPMFQVDKVKRYGSVDS
ncbi:MAG: hypothetical protein ACRDQA_18530 [Nocardioidaceae bacterium]